MMSNLSYWSPNVYVSDYEAAAPVDDIELHVPLNRHWTVGMIRIAVVIDAKAVAVRVDWESE